MDTLTGWMGFAKSWAIGPLAPQRRWWVDVALKPGSRSVPEAEFEAGSRGRVLRNRLSIQSVREIERKESEALLAATELAHPALDVACFESCESSDAYRIQI
jgi:hypothetical protein